MRKTIIALTGASFLAVTATAMTPTPASAFIFLFFAPYLAAHQDPNFKAVNPYAPKKVAKHKHAKKKM